MKFSPLSTLIVVLALCFCVAVTADIHPIQLNPLPVNPHSSSLLTLAGTAIIGDFLNSSTVNLQVDFGLGSEFLQPLAALKCVASCNSASLSVKSYDVFLSFPQNTGLINHNVDAGCRSGITSLEFVVMAEFYHHKTDFPANVTSYLPQVTIQGGDVVWKSSLTDPLPFAQVLAEDIQISMSPANQGDYSTPTFNLSNIHFDIGDRATLLCVTPPYAIFYRQSNNIIWTKMGAYNPYSCDYSLNEAPYVAAPHIGHLMDKDLCLVLSQIPAKKGDNLSIQCNHISVQATPRYDLTFPTLALSQDQPNQAAGSAFALIPTQ